MAAKQPYFDTSYLARLYLCDQGFEAVREIAVGGRVIASDLHGQAEIRSALHRSCRDGRIPESAYFQALDQFLNDSKDGLPRPRRLHTPTEHSRRIPRPQAARQ